MFKKSTAKNPPDKSSPAYMRQQYHAARWNLLAAILFTVINMVLLLIGSDRYFLFSISVPYYGTLLGQIFEVEAAAIIVAAVLLAAYMLCVVLAKKHRGALLTALILFALDSAALLLFMVWAEMYADMTLDILFHVWVLYYLIQGIRYGAKLQAAGCDLASGTEAAEPDAGAYTGPEIDGKPERRNSGPDID